MFSVYTMITKTSDPPEINYYCRTRLRMGQPIFN